MNKISALIMEKWTTLSSIGTVGAGVGTALIAAPEMGLFGIAAGLVAAGATAAGTAIFRPRSQEEVEALLGIEPVHINAALESGETKVSISGRNAATKQLNKILGAVLERKDALGTDIVDAFAALCDNLNAINKQWDRLAQNVDMEYTVETLLSEHLPNSLEAYINVSKNERIKNQDQLKAEIIRQLKIMENTTGKILQSFERQDLAALDTQGRFLESRFSDSVPVAEKDENGLEIIDTFFKNRGPLQIGNGTKE